MYGWEIPEHITLIEKRKAKKLLTERQKNMKPPTLLLERPWLQIEETPSEGMSAKIMTWNVCVILH
jgi:hypothetical protein